MGPYNIIWISDPASTPAARIDRPAAWSIQFLRPEDAPLALASGKWAAIVLECPVPGWSAAALLEEIQRHAPHTPILIRDGEVSPSEAVRLAHLGAREFLSPDSDPFPSIEEVIEEHRRRDVGCLATAVEGRGWERTLVGDSREMRQIAQIIRLVGGRRATVLITGETGTGKEVAARALHVESRRPGPMVAVNCSALPESLLESELFGHVRGAFTGAWQSRIGRFEQANGGTIFLDEVGEMPMELQAKLLRVLQERELQRLGSSETIKVDVRVLAATNCDLPERIEAGKFREDLYYRLNVVPLRMPSLRNRAEDIPLLAAHFIEKVCRAESLPLRRLTPEAEERLCGYPWPGNIRQLENAIETAVALSGDRPMLVPSDFPVLATVRPIPALVYSPLVPLPDGGLDYERTLAGIEKSILEQALRRTGGNKKAAADMLRLKRTTLSAKVRTLAAAG
jgi:DNA-binding NtrC family response regulator